jgi:hypothetical protein
LRTLRALVVRALNYVGGGNNVVITRVSWPPTSKPPIVTIVAMP